MAGNTKKDPQPRETEEDLDQGALMEESTQKTSKPKQVAEPLAPEPSSDETSHALNAFVQANEAIMDSMAALGGEVMEFGNKRVRENIERTEALMRCNDPTEAFRIQHEFFQSATQQYLEQTNKVLTIMTKMTGNFWAPMEESTRETLRNLNKDVD